MSNEKRIAAYMNLHGYTRAQAMAKIKENPAPRSVAPKAAKKRMSKKTYINRPSQAGEHNAPSPRLKSRRKANLDAPKGVYPNPVSNWRSAADYVIQFNDGAFYTGRAGSGYKSYDARDAFRYMEEGAYSKVDRLSNSWMKGAQVDNINDVSSRPRKNPLKPGITARARKGKPASNRKMLSVDYGKSENGPWTVAGVFPNRQLASDYAKAMADKNPSLWWRVATL